MLRIKEAPKKDSQPLDSGVGSDDDDDDGDDDDVDDGDDGGGDDAKFRSDFEHKVWSRVKS